MKTPGKHGDGLWLYVSKPGRAHWYLHYGPRGGQRRMGLGSAAQVSLAQASELARKARQLLNQGIDPIDRRREQQAAADVAKARDTTFTDAVNAYIVSGALRPHFGAGGPVA